MLARQVELVIRREGHPERRMVLSAGAVVVGRADDNDIVLSEIGVSRRHARIAVEDESVVVEDMGSGNGTWHQGKRVTRHVVGDGDEVVIDPFTLGFHVGGGADHTAEVTAGRDATVIMGGFPDIQARLELLSAHPMAQRSYAVPAGGALTLGRSEKAGIVLPEPAASRLHADIGETAGSYWIRDRGSSNGTWVNGIRIREKVLINGDRVRIGTVEFGFVAPPVPVAEETGDHTENFDAVMFTAALPPSEQLTSNLVHPPPPLVATPALAPDSGDKTPPRAFTGLAAAKTVVPPPPSSAPPAPLAAAPRAPPPPPALPFAPRAAAMPRPAPVVLPPAAPPAASTGAPAVEIDFDVDKVKAKKGPRGRTTRRGTGGFFSRPINQISLGILAFAMIAVGGRMVWDLGNAILGASGTRADATATATPAAPATATPSLPTPTLAAATAPPAASASSAAPAPTGTDALPEPAVAARAPATLPPAVPVAPSVRVPLDPARREEVAGLMGEGMRLFTEGKQFEAAAQFYKVQQLDPGNPDAERMGYVACEFIAMQRMYEALQARSSSEAERAAAKQAALAAVVTALADSSQIPAALQLLGAAASLLPGDVELADAAAQLDGRKAAVARGAAVRKEQKKQASLAEMVAAGQREMDRGSLAKAVGQWQAVLDADPSRASPQYYQAEEGIRAAKDKMKADSKKPYAAGLAALKEGDLVTARNQLAQTVRIDPYNDGAASRLSDTRKRLKEQASEIYKEARVLEDINQVEKALGLYQKVLTYVDDPGDPLAGKAQGRINALLQ